MSTLASSSAPALLSPSASDSSVQILDKIFGSGWQSFSVNSSGFLPTILSFYDTILFAVLGVIAIYSLSMGIAEAAHDGVPLGKRYSKWMPFRLIFASAFLAPVSSAGGISVVQNVLLYIVGLSISMANGIWDSGISFLQTKGPVVMTNTHTGTNLGREVLASLVCMNFINDEYYYIGQGHQTGVAVGTSAAPTLPPGPTNYVQINTITSNYVVATPQYSDNFGATSSSSTSTVEQMSGISFDGMPGSNLPPAICGKFMYTYTGTNGARIGMAQVTALSAMIKALQPIADGIVQQTGVLPAPGPIYTAIGNYENALGTMASSITVTQSLANWLSSAKSSGWIDAGSFFFAIAHLNQRLSEQMNHGFDYFGPAVDSIADPSMGTGGFTLRQALSSTQAYYDRSIAVASATAGNPPTAAQMAAASGAISSGGGVMAKIVSILSAPVQNSVSAFAQGVSDGDPIISLSNYGGTVIGAVELAATSLAGFELATNATLGASKGISRGLEAVPVIGGVIGGAVDSLSSSMSAGFKVLKSFGNKAFFSVAIPLIIFGGELQYVIPMTPYIVWTISIMTWMIMIIVALFGIPIWGIMHAMPEGDGFISAEARNGYTFLLDLFLRPSLMLAGFFMSYEVLEAMAKLVVWGYSSALSSITETSITGIVGFIFLFGILANFFLYVTYKTTHMSQTLPNLMNKWVGAGLESFMEGQSGSEKTAAAAKTVTEGAAGGLAAGAVAGSAMIKPALEEAAKKEAERIAAEGTKTDNNILDSPATSQSSSNSGGVDNSSSSKTEGSSGELPAGGSDDRPKL